MVDVCRSSQPENQSRPLRRAQTRPFDRHRTAFSRPAVADQHRRRRHPALEIVRRRFFSPLISRIGRQVPAVDRLCLRYETWTAVQRFPGGF